MHPVTTQVPVTVSWLVKAPVAIGLAVITLDQLFDPARLDIDTPVHVMVFTDLLPVPGWPVPIQDWLYPLLQEPEDGEIARVGSLQVIWGMKRSLKRLQCMECIR